MTDKTKLILQAAELTTLGQRLQIERKRAMRKITKKGYPFSSEEALLICKKLNDMCFRWQRLENEHRKLRTKLGINEIRA